jgi:hypothetical protein
VRGFKIFIILWENLSGLLGEDPRLSLFGGRISQDEGRMTQDCHYSVGESLRIMEGGSQIVIIWWENLSGFRRDDSRLSLFCGRISPNYGRRIPDCHYSLGESLWIKVGGSKLVIILWKTSPD